MAKRIWKDVELVIREVKSKPQWDTSTHPTRITVIKKTDSKKKCGESGMLIYCWWENKMVHRYFKNS